MLPRFVIHFHQGAVTRDTGIVYDRVNRTKIGGNPRTAVKAGLMIGDIPFISRNARRLGEPLRAVIIPRIIGRH